MVTRSCPSRRGEDNEKVPDLAGPGLVGIR